LQERAREAHRDRGALTRRALHLERAATDLSTLPHHRHAEVTFGPRRIGVEPHAVVPELEHDGLLLLVHPDPEVRCLRVLERVHHRFARDVEDQ
jgi:hypothetical protein